MSDIATTDSKDIFAQAERAFKLSAFLARSSIIPKHFQGQEANCFIALEMSQRLNINFFELVNGLYIVHGSPAFSGAFTISMINRSGLYKGGLNFKTEGKGDQMQVTAYATKPTGELCSATVSMKMAKDEGWTKNTKYQTMPEHMLTFRSASFFCRRYCPEILMGAQLKEEIEDMTAAEALKEKQPSVNTVMLDIAEQSSLSDNHALFNSLVDKAVALDIPETALVNICDKYGKNEDLPTIRQGIDFLQTMISDKMLERKSDAELPSDRF